jgi:hypothetical protein
MKRLKDLRTHCVLQCVIIANQILGLRWAVETKITFEITTVVEFLVLNAKRAQCHTKLPVVINSLYDPIRPEEDLAKIVVPVFGNDAT